MAVFANTSAHWHYWNLPVQQISIIILSTSLLYRLHIVYMEYPTVLFKRMEDEHREEGNLKKKANEIHSIAIHTQTVRVCVCVCALTDITYSIWPFA